MNLSIISHIPCYSRMRMTRGIFVVRAHGRGEARFPHP